MTTVSKERIRLRCFGFQNISLDDTDVKERFVLQERKKERKKGGGGGVKERGSERRGRTRSGGGRGRRETARALIGSRID